MQKQLQEILLPIGGLVAAFLIVRFGFGFNGLYGQDSHEYLRYARELKAWLPGGDMPQDYFWPVGYPLVGVLVSFVVQNMIWALQLVSLLALAGVFIYTQQLLQHFHPQARHRQLYLVLFLLLSPLTLRAGMLVMSDMLTVLGIVGSCYHVLTYKRKTGIKHVLLFALWAALALLTRYAAAPLLLLPLLFMLWLLIRDYRWGHLLAGLALGAAVLLPHFILKEGGIAAFGQHSFLQEWSGLNYFKRSFSTTEGHMSYTSWNLTYALYNWLHPTFMLGGLVLIPFLKREHLQSWDKRLLVLAIAVYGLFLAGLPFQNMRFLLLSFPLVLLVFFPAFVRVQERMQVRPGVMYLALVLLVAGQLAFNYYYFKQVVSLNHMEKEIALAVKTEQPQTVYCFYVDGALNSYGSETNIINLYHQAIEDYQRGALVVFNEARFAEQWKGRNPMLNWNYLNTHYQLKPIKQYPNGWTIHEIE